MNLINQPISVTDMRRDPKGIIKRVQKENILPILVHSEFEAALISVKELNRMIRELKELRHQNFVYETLESAKEVKEGKYNGPFDTVEEAMDFLNRDE